MINLPQQATSQTPIVYTELDFDEDGAASAAAPMIHCREEPSVYAAMELD